MLRRYIENEYARPNFLECKDYEQITDEILLFAYFAGHGCVDTSQCFVLNEYDLKKIFWNAEENLMQLAEICGCALKEFVVFDICREPRSKTEEMIL